MLKQFDVAKKLAVDDGLSDEKHKILNLAKGIDVEGCVTVTLLVKVSQGHNYQIATNKTCMAHEVLFLQIAHMSRQTTANKLSTGHRVLFLQIAHASGETGANKLSMGYGSLFL